MTKAVAKTEEKSTAVATGFNYGEYAGKGFENVKASELSIPFIAILQSNSPQVEDKDPEGAEAGMLFNTVTKELTKGEDGIIFQPVHKETGFVEWIPRTRGGGFVAMHDPEGEVVKTAVERNGGAKFGKLQVGENDLVETHYVYGLLLSRDGSEVNGFAVLSFKSTAIKPFRDWLTSMRLLKGKPPIFANRAILRTTKQKNEKGSFYNYKISPLKQDWISSLIDPEKESGLLQAAVEFIEQINNGLARADFSQERAAGAAPEDSESAPF